MNSPTTTPRSRFWDELSTHDFAQLDPARTVAVLPVAATEQHGPHLPLNVDAALIDAVVKASLPHLHKEASVLFLPTQAIGKSDEHIRFAGTLTLSAATLIQLWTEIGASVARAGIKKLLLLNSHGGQVSVMDIVARELRMRHDMLVYHSNWYNLPLGDAVLQRFSAEEHRFGIHGGDIETSMMLAIAPHLVDMSQARDFKSTSQTRAQQFPILGNGVSAKLGWQMQDYNRAGAAGNAANANADKGRALIEAAGQQLAALLWELQTVQLGE
jgi:creatinine amidohydrolase